MYCLFEKLYGGSAKIISNFFFVLKNYESSNKSDKIIFLGKFEKFKDYYEIASKYSIIDFVDLTNNSSIINDSPFFSIVNENYIRN